MTIFFYDNYKTFVNDWIQAKPKKGYGQFKKIADHLRVSPVVISQIFKGSRELNLEQGCELSRFLDLDEKETEFMLLLIQKARAGSKNLENIFNSQIKSFRTRAKNLKSQIQHEDFDDSAKATFYSHWFYSGVRVATNISDLNTAEEISEALQLPVPLVRKILNFLTRHKLVVNKNGRLDVGPQVTHVPHDSPFVFRHHNNWRLKGLQCMEQTQSVENLFYTGPMAISKKASEDIRLLAVEMIKEVTRLAVASNGETVHCLNLDWFEVTR